MQNKKIGFIGAGNMACAIMKGLIKNNIAPENIFASSPDEMYLLNLKKELGIQVSTNNLAISKKVDCLILAVKPQIITEVLQELATTDLQKCLLISVAAGISCELIQSYFNETIAIIRAMPNTPALISQGATGLFANAFVSNIQRDLAQDIFAAIGITAWLEDEAKINSITALSGSGPAYVFLFLEALAKAGEHLGLSKTISEAFALQTVVGAANLCLHTQDKTFAQLREQVTSKGGTTEAALKSLAQAGFENTIENALDAALQRARELGAKK